MKDGSVYQIKVTDAQRVKAQANNYGGSRKRAGTFSTSVSGLPEASADKVLTSNDDGTYTLTLSMEVPKITSSSSNRANVVIIFDSSNSMHYDVPGNEWIRDDEHGTYCEVGGKYYQLNNFGSDVRRVFSYIDENGDTHPFGIDLKNNIMAPMSRPPAKNNW